MSCARDLGLLATCCLDCHSVILAVEGSPFFWLCSLLHPSSILTVKGGLQDEVGRKVHDVPSLTWLTCELGNLREGFAQTCLALSFPLLRRAIDWHFSCWQGILRGRGNKDTNGCLSLVLVLQGSPTPSCGLVLFHGLSGIGPCKQYRSD